MFDHKFTTLSINADEVSCRIRAVRVALPDNSRGVSTRCIRIHPIVWLTDPIGIHPYVWFPRFPNWKLSECHVNMKNDFEAE